MIAIEKGIQAFTHNIFKYIFRYLITGRLHDSCYNIILNLFLKTGTTFVVFNTEWKTPV